jgi:hypothetical protein
MENERGSWTGCRRDRTGHPGRLRRNTLLPLLRLKHACKCVPPVFKKAHELSRFWTFSEGGATARGARMPENSRRHRDLRRVGCCDPMSAHPGGSLTDGALEKLPDSPGMPSREGDRHWVESSPGGPAPGRLPGDGARSRGDVGARRRSGTASSAQRRSAAHPEVSGAV